MVMTKEQKMFYEDIIVEAIKQEDEAPKTSDRKKLLSYVDQRFRRENGHEIRRLGEHQARINWLQGLAIDIPYMNHEIIEVSKRSGSLRKDATPREEQKILDNYWNFMAMQIHHANKKYRIDQEDKPKIKPSLKPQIVVREHKRTGTKGVRRHVRRR